MQNYFSNLFSSWSANQAPLFAGILLVTLSIPLLWKSADWFVDGAVGVAQKLRIPKMLVGMVLVSLATTAPELTASLMAALSGNPEMALGNAVGSIVVDDTMALGLAALLSPVALLAEPKILRTTAMFLLSITVLAFIMSLDGVLSRLDGGILVLLFGVYAGISMLQEQRRRKALVDTPPKTDLDKPPGPPSLSGRKIMLLFSVGLCGILIGSHLLVEGAIGLAQHFHVPSAIIGVTIVAIGTSIPEVATAISSALKGHSEIGVGNILGADILNICWVAGLSAIANPLQLQAQTVYAMFPAMLVVVLTMLILLRINYKLTRWKGAVLVALYLIYIPVVLLTSPSSDTKQEHPREKTQAVGVR